MGCNFTYFFPIAYDEKHHVGIIDFFHAKFLRWLEFNHRNMIHLEIFGMKAQLYFIGL